MDYSELVGVYEKLEATTKRLEKTFVIADFLKKSGDLNQIVLLLQGRVFPSYDQREIGMASKLMIKAISFATGTDARSVETRWKELGDLGDVAKALIEKKKQSTLFQHKLTVQKVFNNLTKLASLVGKGSVDQKIQLIAELLTSAEPLEAKYIVRTILGELRVGVAAGILRDAIVWAYFGEKAKIRYEVDNITIGDREAYNSFTEAVQEAYDMSNDFARVAEAAKSGCIEGLKQIGLQVGVPIKVMLALKVRDIDEGLERVGVPAEIEYKYDGFRMQIHKHDNKITIFTRRLEDVTAQFPEVVGYVKKLVEGKSYILDSEAVGYDAKTKKYLPFQHISQRIKRKYNIKEMAERMPVEVNIFDIIYYEGKSLLNEPFEKRRKLLEKIVSQEPLKLVLAKSLVTKDASQVKKFFEDAVSVGNEGVMFKNLKAPYKPGARVGYMVKLKPTIDTLELVIVGAEWGEGKRAKWLSSYTIACIDEEGNFLEVGKVSTGLKEKSSEGVSFEEITELLKPLIISQKGREVRVKPQVVVEVTYEEIQKSPTYPSGYALRFPRFVSVRYERLPEDITPLDTIEEVYYQQKK